jgi:hypothetical protein
MGTLHEDPLINLLEEMAAWGILRERFPPTWGFTGGDVIAPVKNRRTNPLKDAGIVTLCIHVPFHKCPARNNTNKAALQTTEVRAILGPSQA